MKKIELKSTTISEDIDFHQMESECVIDFKTEIKEQPIAISCGQYTENGKVKDISFGSYGDYSVIVGPSKTMKSTLKRAIASCYIGGDSNKYFDNFKGVSQEKKWVFVLDAEQSPFHVKRGVNIVEDMVGVKYPYFKSYKLRGKSPEQMRGFLDWLLLESQYSESIGLICLDGVADFVSSSNNEEESYSFVRYLMKITDENQIHLIASIHKTTTSEKATGHLGSALQKYAETVLFLKEEGGKIKAKPKNSRNKKIEEFEFFINDEGIPEMVGVNQAKMKFNEDGGLPF